MNKKVRTIGHRKSQNRPTVALNFTKWWKYWPVFSERELALTIAICYQPSVCCLLSVCLLSLCLSVTLVHPTQAVKLFGNFFSPYDSSGTLLFWCQKSLVGDAPFPLKFSIKVTTPLKQRNFDQYRLIAPQPWYLAKKVQLALIKSRPHDFQRAVDKPCTLPLSPPKGGTKTRYRWWGTPLSPWDLRSKWPTPLSNSTISTNIGS